MVKKKDSLPDGETTKNLNPFADLELRGLGDYVKMIRERWIIAVSSSLLVVCLVGYFQLKTPRLYEAHSTLLLERQSERVVDMERVVDTGLEGNASNYTTLLQTQMEQIRSRSFRDYVLESFSEKEIAAIVKPYRNPEAGAPEPNPRNILGGVSTENVRNTYLIRIGFRHRDPVVAAMVADRFAEQYIRFAVDRSSSGNNLAISFLTEQADELRDKVEEANRALQEYRQEHNLVSAEENQNIIVQRLQAVNAALTEARVERLALEDQMSQVDDFQEKGLNVLEVGAISRFGSNPELALELDRLRKQREVIGDKYAERHPQMIENQRAIDATERTLKENIAMAVADLRSRLANARSNEESLRKEMREVEQESLRLDQLAIHYQVLRGKADSAKATHSQIIHRLNETAITSQLESTNIKISDRAVVPYAPIEPNLRRVALLLLFLGGFVFVGLPIGLEFFDNKVKTAWDVEHFLGQRLAGEIPSVAKLSEPDRGHIVERDVQDEPVEAFRGLFSQLELTSEIDYPKTMIVTSTLPGEGKSFVASNLAYCFAAHGKKTLLVDCDFRRPVLHAMYKLDNKHGLLACLEEEGEISLDSELMGIREVAPNLFLLRAGGHTRKATEKLKDPRVEKFFAALRTRFDMVIVDTAPAGVFPDALALAGFADESLYVARYGKVNRQQVKSFLDRLGETDALPAGIVLNAMPHGKRSSYGYYGNYKYQSYYEKQAT